MDHDSKSAIPNQQSKISGIALKEEFVGAKTRTIQGEKPSVTKVNYFKGNDPEKWKNNISTYDFVNLGEIYKGIELKLKAYGDNVEKLFCVKPGASPDQIQVQLNGGKSLKINDEGQLVAETELGTVRFTKPMAYQEINGRRVEVDVEYRIQKSEVRSQKTEARSQKTVTSPINPKSKTCGERSRTIRNLKSEYGFKVAAYDMTKDLVIDPLLASTYLGLSNDDQVGALTIDTSGNVYVTGSTFLTDFPTTSGAYDTSYNGSGDVFVSKLNNELTSLLASTYLGGSRADYGYALTLDTSGNVYVTGSTSSTDFPTTSGAYDTTVNRDHDYTDVFVSKLNNELTSLLASTYLGGSRADYGYALTLDTSGNIYVRGYTDSTDFPTTSGAYDTSFNGISDVFVSKLNSGLTSLLASTYLGGSREDFGYALTLDTSGNVYVTGYTYTPDFPTTNGAYDTSYNGDNADVFISKLNSELTNLLASTYLGGSLGDQCFFGFNIDTSGNVYVTGFTSSPDFPMTSGAYDTSYNGIGDIFVSKLNSGLTSLLASTYLGGSWNDGGYALTIDTSGNVYVTGITSSADFPTTSSAYDTTHNGGYYDAFVTKFNSGLTSLLTSTYLGGSGPDVGYTLVVDTWGNVYTRGSTNSPDFPTTSGAYDTSYNGGNYDVFVSKLDGNLSASTPTPTSTPISTVADSWTQKADFPSTGMREPLSFSIGNKGYIVSYKKYFYTFSKNNLLNLNSKLRDDNEFFKFQPKSDYFTSKSSQMILV